MNCTINSASNFSGLQAGISQISPAQLAASVRKSTLNRPFISPILSHSTQILKNGLGAPVTTATETYTLFLQEMNSLTRSTFG